MLCYLFSPIAGIILILMEKENKFIRFHALQSIFFAVAIWVITIGVMIIGGILGALSGGIGCLVNALLPLFWLFVLVVAILMMVKSYQGEYYKLPVIGDMAEKYV